MVEIKKCYCGGQAYHHLSHIRCMDCNISMVGVQGKEELIRAWNTRPLIDKLHKDKFYLIKDAKKLQAYVKEITEALEEARFSLKQIKNIADVYQEKICVEKSQNKGEG